MSLEWLLARRWEKTYFCRWHLMEFTCLRSIENQVPGIIVCFAKELSLQKRAFNSVEYAGRAFRLPSVCAGCQCNKRPCVPLAKRCSTARFALSITRIRCVFGLGFFVSRVGCQSPSQMMHNHLELRSFTISLSVWSNLALLVRRSDQPSLQHQSFRAIVRSSLTVLRAFVQPPPIVVRPFLS